MESAKVKYKLKGHETFILREGWLYKGLQAVIEDPKVFSKNQGADALGVGTNMAKAIRYWLKTAELIKETPGMGAELSTLGHQIFDNDPYFEDIFSLWLVHINIAKNCEKATSWYLFFNKMAEEFTKDELLDDMEQYIKKYVGIDEISLRSVKDDCNAILSMYYSQKENDYDPEDKKVSPFAMFGMLKKNGNRYKKMQPNLKLLHSYIVLICMEIMLGADWKSVSIDLLVDGKNGPGKLLNLSRNGLNNYLDELENNEFITVNRTAGLDMVYRQSNITKEELIKKYYEG